MAFTSPIFSKVIYLLESGTTPVSSFSVSGSEPFVSNKFLLEHLMKAMDLLSRKMHRGMQIQLCTYNFARIKGTIRNPFVVTKKGDERPIKIFHSSPHYIL